jgi:hypothetical protein
MKEPEKAAGRAMKEPEKQSAIIGTVSTNKKPMTPSRRTVSWNKRRRKCYERRGGVCLCLCSHGDEKKNNSRSHLNTVEMEMESHLNTVEMEMESHLNTVEMEMESHLKTVEMEMERQLETQRS